MRQAAQAATIFELSSQDVSEIIITSAKCGVSRLKFGNLEIEFGKQTNSPETPQGSGHVDTTSTPDKAISDQTHEQNSLDSLVKDELQTRADQLEQMQIEDPLRAEQMLLDEELEDDDESDDTDTTE